MPSEVIFDLQTGVGTFPWILKEAQAAYTKFLEEHPQAVEGFLATLRQQVHYLVVRHVLSRLNWLGILLILIFATIPFAPGLGVADLNIGVLFFLAVSSLEIVGLFMGGWGSNNKYALLSAMRAVNQIISYDLPFIFAALVPVVLAGSLQMSAIVEAQRGLWFVGAWYVLGPLAFLAFLVATLAAENRVPFDILEAESELVAGFRVEYSGMKFSLIMLGEYAHMIGTSFLGALLFLGGWLGPGPEWLGPVWFLLKALFVFLVVTWVRWSFVRIRVDQILAISWKLLLPLTLLLLMVTAFLVAWSAGGA